MAEGRCEYVDRGQWNHTASLVASIQNVMKGKNQKATQPRDVNPYTTNDKDVRENMTREQFAKSAGLPTVVGKVKKPNAKK